MSGLILICEPTDKSYVVQTSEAVIRALLLDDH